ncbi:hypothetical protein TELCIR_12762 [Teladorsagia circumcincta]|uniref:Serine carboxypeptidase S28 n=1 Tax=Teladorsagia circumcincta TaxID=45464 RepID=A0A2G9U7T1_TELCI|nr:hypothetical protein TELCIR_12762 [Teladorsagia circumcincta]
MDPNGATERGNGLPLGTSLLWLQQTNTVCTNLITGVSKKTVATFRNMTTAELVYLSSAQALEDMAAFIIAMKVKMPQLATVPWVTFGGSYSGALAAWARVKHPELVAMAVGSSGPVQAEVDFVGRSFAIFLMFSLCEDLVPTDAKQIETFWQTVYSPYMEIVQYSGDNAYRKAVLKERSKGVVQSMKITGGGEVRV